MPGEVALARRLHLPVVANSNSFALPCTALVQDDADRHCSIYLGRPESCRQFVCELYARHERERGSRDDGMAVVRRAKALIAFLDDAGMGASDGDKPSCDVDAGPRREAWMPVVFELTQILNLHFARGRTRPESADNGERPARMAQVAACWVGRPKVSARGRGFESRPSRHPRMKSVVRGGAAPHAMDEALHVVRIERGVGRPLAPPLEPAGDGGNRRGSAKHRRATSLDALSLPDSVDCFGLAAYGSEVFASVEVGTIGIFMASRRTR
jgi:hypothetical protein